MKILILHIRYAFLYFTYALEQIQSYLKNKHKISLEITFSFWKSLVTYDESIRHGAPVYKIDDYVRVKSIFHRSHYEDYIFYQCVKIIDYSDSVGNPIVYQGLVKPNSSITLEFHEKDVQAYATRNEIDSFERTLDFYTPYDKGGIVKMKNGEILHIERGFYLGITRFFVEKFRTFVFESEIERAASPEEVFAYIMENDV